MLFLATFQIEAVCAFPRYIPPLSASQLSCFAQRGEKPTSCLPWETLVMFHPELESATGMLERPGRGVLKRCPPPPLARALCCLCTHHLPLPSGTTVAPSCLQPARERGSREGKSTC